MMWTPEEDAKLLQLWSDFRASEIAAMLGRSKNAVIGRYHRLCGSYRDYISPKKQDRHREWVEKQKQNHQRQQKAIMEMKRKIARDGGRNTAIIEAARAGARFRAIADEIGVTFQRIQQIVIAESVEAA